MQLENDKGHLAAKLQTRIQETDSIRQALQREHQQVVEQLNVRTCKGNVCTVFTRIKV